MPALASSGQIESARPEEAQIRASVTWKAFGVPTVVPHDDLVCSFTVQSDSLQEFTCVPRPHSVIAHVVWRQWPLSLRVNKLEKLMPFFIFFFLELHWLAPNESLVQSRFLYLNKNVVFTWNVIPVLVCDVSRLFQLVDRREIWVVVYLADVYWFLGAILIYFYQVSVCLHGELVSWGFLLLIHGVKKVCVIILLLLLNLVCCVLCLFFNSVCLPNFAFLIYNVIRSWRI